MTRLFAYAGILILIAGPTQAAEPTGDWLVKDGSAHIRIDYCGGKLWGVVAWEQNPGTDTENPNPARRARQILGIPILLGMNPVQPNKWEGEIYNSQNGKIYSARIGLLDDNTLKLEGCVLGGLFCGGENWTRVTTPPTGGVALPSAKSAPAAKAPAASKKTGPAQPAQSEVCARVAEETAQNSTKETARP
jgi:uncharacterized protein (DUF2147 family)